MTLGLIFKRMRREWRPLAILLLAVCLLTGFFALGPFYVRAVTDVGLRFELDRARPEALQITLIVDDEPLTPESFQVVREELDSLAVSYEHFIRADYNPPTTEEGLNAVGLATGGYLFAYGDDVTPYSSRTNRAYQPFAFANMPDKLDLVAGRWPVRLPPPSVVNPAGLSDAEQQARQVGKYNRGQVEVVITQTVARKAGLELGSRLVLGTLLPGGSGHVASIVVVGIVEPKNPNDPYWEGNRNFLEGADVEMGLGFFRYDYGMATIPEAYTDWLRVVTPGNSYIYTIKTDTGVITADNIQDITRRLRVLQSRLSAYHPGIAVLSGLTTLLEGFSGDVSDTEGPIILLSGAILILMLYHLINTVALVLEQQGTEWSTIVSRGGSIRQLVIMQAATIGLIGVAGLVLGPLISIGFMKLLENFGPLASALGDRPLGVTRIPRISFYLSAGAALAAVVVLIVPALPAARRSLLRLKQLVSRPPTTPAWARFALDGVLLAVGIGFLLRLYYLVGGSLGALLNNLVAAPRDVIRLIADNLTATGGLNDPFNLLGPALVMTGAALLWLRLFPRLMALVARFFQGSRHLVAPLAVWNVARDPSHYAQLVLLLIGTLALGTASLGLSETRDRGAWSAARQETGGSARITVDPARLDPATVRWERLPGVSSSLVLMRAAGDPGSISRRPVQIIGVDSDAAAAIFPELAAIVAPLRGIEVPAPPGLEIPQDARTLTVQVYSLRPVREDDPLVTVEMVAYVQDALGVPYRVLLTLPELGARADLVGDPVTGELPTPTDEWLTFSGSIPPQGRLPYRLVRIGLTSRQSNIDVFEHTIYLDRIAVQDIFGTSRTLDSFEDSGPAWEEATVANPYAASWTTEAANISRVRGVTVRPVTDEIEAVEGQAALRLDYRMGSIGGRRREPSIVTNPPTAGRIPVVINRLFAERFTGRGTYRTAADEPLQVGDTKTVVLSMGPGSIELGYEVVGVVDSIPSLPAGDPAMVTVTALIQPVINQVAASNLFFANNEVWLDLPAREPTPALEAEIDRLNGVTGAAWAWTRYGEIQREPLPSAVAGMLFAGFWISLALSLLDFAFYLVVTARQRAFTFGVLRSLGWDAGAIWRLLLIEQVVLITPALVIGSLIGAGLAYLLLPFLALVGGETLKLPWLSLAGLLLALVGSFTALMGVAAVFLRRMSVNQVLRLGEE